MIRIKAIAALVLAALLFSSAGAFANSEANLGGNVTAKNVYYGPQGAVSVIELTINTLDGLTWTAVCRRSTGNLGYCSGASVGNNVQVQGIITVCGSVEVTYLGVKFP